MVHWNTITAMHMNIKQAFGEANYTKRPINNMQTPIIEIPPMKIYLLVNLWTVKIERIAPKKPEAPMK